MTYDGRPVRPAKATRLYRFYKPPATLTAAHDPKGRATIYDRLPPGLPRLMPVGRLDYMTEGLLLLTNDGELKRQLELPALAGAELPGARFRQRDPGAARGACRGVTIEGVRYGSIDANLERRTGRHAWIEMTGGGQEPRGSARPRTSRPAGLPPHPHRYGPLTLAGLDPGAVEEVAAAELAEFRNALK